MCACVRTRACAYIKTRAYVDDCVSRLRAQTCRRLRTRVRTRVRTYVRVDDCVGARARRYVAVVVVSQSLQSLAVACNYWHTTHTQRYRIHGVGGVGGVCSIHGVCCIGNALTDDSVRCRRQFTGTNLCRCCQMLNRKSPGKC